MVSGSNDATDFWRDLARGVFRHYSSTVTMEILLAVASRNSGMTPSDGDVGALVFGRPAVLHVVEGKGGR